MTYLLFALALVFLLVLTVWTVSLLQPVKRRFRVTRGGRTRIGKYKARWFPWPSDNVTFGWTTFAKHVAIFTLPTYAPTIRHETAGHGFQYEDRGAWWVWTHFLGQAERDAKALEQDTSIRVEEL